MCVCVCVCVCVRDRERVKESQGDRARERGTENLLENAVLSLNHLLSTQTAVNLKLVRFVDYFTTAMGWHPCDPMLN